jgi:membrane-bound lytic murein transglycosylase D
MAFGHLPTHTVTMQNPDWENEVSALRGQITHIKRLVKSLLILVVIIMALFSLSTIYLASNNKKAPEREILIYKSDSAGVPAAALVWAYEVPDSLTLFGEPFPIYRPDVAERLDMELLITVYRHSATLLAFKRSQNLFKRMRPILVEEGIHEDFLYLAVAESNLGMVISPAGASGIWQFMAETGRSYGLEVNHEIDERYHIEKSTRAAARYLKDAYKSTGSWILAAAGYNMGTFGIQRQMEQQGMPGYFDLRLNQETARYIFRIMAIKLFWENPTAFGYTEAAISAYPLIPSRPVVLSERTDLMAYARENGYSYYLIRELNPWVRGSVLPATAVRPYTIQVPENLLQTNAN